jgi:hypothetical protein
MRRVSAWAAPIVALLFLLAGCATGGQGSASTTPSTTSATATPLPTLPVGDYAFLRDGDIWARTGGSVPHAITQLHLSAAAANWGPIAWSPDHNTLAVELNAPPLAPGYLAHDPAQSTGSLFTVDVAAGKLSLIAGSVPLLGQHAAWYTDSGNATHLLFTSGGKLFTTQPGTANTAPTPLNGPTNVWEIAVRGTMLFYSTVQHIASTGTGTAELHAFDLATQHDRLVATLGPATLPVSACSGIVCLPDMTTPYVPYAWSVSNDGTVIAYQASAAAPVPAPTPTATPKPTATAHPYALPLTTTTPTATGTPHFFVLTSAATTPQPIFTDLAALTQPGEIFRLAVAPNGQNVALALADFGSVPYGPYVEATTAGATAHDDVLSGALDSGTPSWSPDSQGFSLDAISSAPPPQTPNVATFLLNGQSALQEQNGAALVWGQ